MFPCSPVSHLEPQHQKREHLDIVAVKVCGGYLIEMLPLCSSSMLEEQISVNWLEYDIKVQLSTFMTELPGSIQYMIPAEATTCVLSTFSAGICTSPICCAATMPSSFITIRISFVKYATGIRKCSFHLVLALFEITYVDATLAPASMIYAYGSLVMAF
jgi:hypothetical protein